MIEQISNVTTASERATEVRNVSRPEQATAGAQASHSPVPVSAGRVEMSTGVLASAGMTDASSQSVVAARSARLEAAIGDAAIHKSMSDHYREDAQSLTNASALGEVRIFPEQSIKPERDILA